jgi:hypothetical protein
MANARVVFLFFLLATCAFTQINTSTLDGLVRDPQGALIPGAQITVVNTQTGQTFQATADSAGHWAIPAMSTGIYRVTVAAQGFKKASADSVKLDAGIPATVNLTLEIGAVTETVEVTGGAEVLQTTSATVTTNLTGQQIRDLPIVSRNATDLLVVQPGAQTPAGPRNTTFNGLPQAAVNMTYDGINIQDNLLKNSSGGAFYPVVYPRLEAVEEVSVTTSAAGADALGEGAVQVKFITRSGTNQYHGSAFIQERNTFFNANYYFNNIDGLARNRIILHQIGAAVGGPIKKDRVFFFVNYEVFRFPQSWTINRTVLNESARNGIFTYRDTTGAVRNVNLYQIAGARNQTLPASIRQFPTTADPLIAQTLSQIAQVATAQNGTLRDQIQTASDYNRNTFTFLAPGSHKIDFPRVRLDANLTSKHHLETIFNIDPYRLFPDGINSIFPFLPGSGAVLGSDYIAGQREQFFTAVAAVRSTWASNWISEVRFGLGGGSVLFSDGIGPAMFAPWRGYGPNLPFVSSPFTTINPSRRNNPVKQTNWNMNWIRSGHVVNFGGTYSSIREWLWNTGTYVTPQITFGIAANDPVNTGATSIFDTTNFPNSSPTDRSNAGSLYALLTGRVSSIARSLALDEETKKYGNQPQIQRIKQWEYGLYVQDSWRIHPKLTLNYGLRYEHQDPVKILNGVYTRPGYEGLFGVSGVGNLFKPGTLTGQVPQYVPVESASTTGYPPTRFLSPTAGFAWTLPQRKGPLGWLLGGGGLASVLRVGFSMTTTRDQLNTIWGNNQGRTITTTVDPANTPGDFGSPGSVLFRDPSLPVRSGVSTTPTYPIPVTSGVSVNDYDPKLKARFVQSWNVGFQRSLSKDTVLEVRYVGNRSERAWTSLNLNEVNIIENGFLDEFKIAQANLALARQTNPNSTQFAGLAGQQPLPIIQTALALNSDTNTATLIAQGQAGGLASNISGNATRMGNLVRAGRAVNFFIVNPTTGGSGANLTTNLGGSTYNAMQLELRRRMAAGLMIQGSYTWSHSLTTGNIQTLRNLDGFTTPSGFDIRHAVKLNWIYELPIGRNHRLLGSLQNPVLRKVAEGWQIAGVARLQTGTPNSIGGGRSTFNAGGGGIILNNITQRELQDMIQIRKTTAANGQGVVYWLPQDFINNTLAAFEVGGFSLNNLDRSKPYISPGSTPGQFAYQVYLYGPPIYHWDLSAVKMTRVTEKQSIEFRAQFLNAFNLINFFLQNVNGSSTNFGQTRSAYTDLNSTNDPGGRVIEFVLRYRF